MLVLTQTNAGVTALRLRLNRAAVPSTRYRLATIDGWALKLISLYPGLAGRRNGDGVIDYPATRGAAVAIVESGVLSPVLRAIYGRLVVDEYQDCSAQQHWLIRALAAELPSPVLGDPLQCVFDFNGAPTDWTLDVLAAFPTVLQLDEPHRWMNAGQEEFCRWLLDIREPLLRGTSIDLENAPANLRWQVLPADVGERLPARMAAVLAESENFLPDHKLMVIADSQPVSTRLDFARATRGMQVVEPVDLKDMIEAAARIDATVGVARLNAVIGFVRDTMKGPAWSCGNAGPFAKSKAVSGRVLLQPWCQDRRVVRSLLELGREPPLPMSIERGDVAATFTQLDNTTQDPVFDRIRLGPRVGQPAPPGEQ